MSAILELVYNGLKHGDNVDKFINARNIVERLLQNEIKSIDECVELDLFVETIVRKYFKSAQITLGVKHVVNGFFEVNSMVIFSDFNDESYDFIIMVNEPIYVYTHENIPKGTKRIHLFTYKDSVCCMKFE